MRQMCMCTQRIETGNVSKGQLPDQRAENSARPSLLETKKSLSLVLYNED